MAVSPAWCGYLRLTEDTAAAVHNSRRRNPRLATEGSMPMSAVVSKATSAYISAIMSMSAARYAVKSEAMSAAALSVRDNGPRKQCSR